MNNIYFNKKQLTSLCLLAIGLVSFNANSQCTAVATFTEDFNGLTALPTCWNASLSNYGVSISGDALQLYSGGATGTEIIVVTPEVSTIDGNHVLAFDIASNTDAANTTIEIGTMTDNTDFTTFSSVGSTSSAAGSYTSAAIPANAGHKYVAIKYGFPAGTHIVLKLDNVEWKSATASAPKFDTSKVNVYPNPTTGIFNVETELDVKQIDVYNSLGQKVLSTSNRQINLQTAANGLYFVTVITNDGAQASYKLIKK